MRDCFRLFLLLLVGGISGCDNQPRVINPQGEVVLNMPVIDGIVNATDSIVFVQISKVKSFNEVIPISPDRITDAIVVVSVDRGQEVPLIYESPYYRAKINAPSGSSVTLTVKIGNGTYTAEAIIPDLVSDINYASLERQNFRLSWGSDPSRQAFYEVQFAPETGLAYNVSGDSEHFFAAKSARVDVTGEYYQSTQPEPGKEDLLSFHIHSLDSNLYYYKKKGLKNEVFGSAPIHTAEPYSNFKGAIGVFGAYVTTKFEVGAGGVFN